MDKKLLYDGDLSLYPCPTVLVTSKWKDCENVLTVSWAGIASSHPEYVTIAINRKRYSYALIKESLKFCINIPNSDMAEKVDYCGSNSGRVINKFQSCDLKKIYYEKEYIIINDCPVNLICTVEHIYPLGSHDLFISHVHKKYIDRAITDIHKQLKPIVYFRPNYYDIGENILGFYGFTQEINNRNDFK